MTFLVSYQIPLDPLPKLKTNPVNPVPSRSRRSLDFKEATGTSRKTCENTLWKKWNFSLSFQMLFTYLLHGKCYMCEIFYWNKSKRSLPLRVPEYTQVCIGFVKQPRTKLPLCILRKIHFCSTWVYKAVKEITSLFACVSEAILKKIFHDKILLDLTREYQDGSLRNCSRCNSLF